MFSFSEYDKTHACLDVSPPFFCGGALLLVLFLSFNKISIFRIKKKVLGLVLIFVSHVYHAIVND